MDYFNSDLPHSRNDAGDHSRKDVNSRSIPEGNLEKNNLLGIVKEPISKRYSLMARWPFLSVTITPRSPFSSQ
jgi:hypothetical protein